MGLDYFISFDAIKDDLSYYSNAIFLDNTFLDASYND